MKRILWLMSVMMLGFAPASAQKQWSLEECISYALENNLQIKRQELNVAYNKNNLHQSYFNTLPNLNGQLSYTNNDGKTLDYSTEIPSYVNTNYWYSNMGISSSVTLFGGFQAINNIMKSKYDFLKSESDLETSRNEIALQLALGYLQVLFSKELLEVAKSKLDVTTLQTERTRKMLDAGNVAQGEFLQIKAQESADKTSLINAQNNLSIAYLDLTQLLDLDSVAGFDIVIPNNIEVELLAPLIPVNDIYAIALTSMPQIKSAQYALKSSEKQLSMAWGQVSPSLSLFGNLSSQYFRNAIDQTNPTESYSFRSQISDYYNKSIGFQLSVPIFNKFQVKNNISNAKLQLKDYQIQLEAEKMALYKEVQQAHADAMAAREKYYSNVEGVKFSEEAFKYTRQKFEVGLVNSVDYSVSQNSLINAKSEMLKAKYEYIFKLKILDLYMDKSLSL